MGTSVLSSRLARRLASVPWATITEARGTRARNFSSGLRPAEIWSGVNLPLGSPGTCQGWTFHGMTYSGRRPSFHWTPSMRVAASSSPAVMKPDGSSVPMLEKRLMMRHSSTSCIGSTYGTLVPALVACSVSQSSLTAATLGS